MKKLLIIVFAFFLALALSYRYGQKHEREQAMTQKAEILKNVAKKRAKIQSRPHCRRDELLELMRRGEL